MEQTAASLSMRKIGEKSGKAAYFAVIAAPSEIYYGQKERWTKHV
ncbi:hypothetical protein [Cloacibacillus sp.]|nr:hypothetical protein [Cloacibacillus sp.]